MKNATVDIVEADLNLPTHQKAVVAMTAAYALDAMGNGGPLEAEALERLVPGLRSLPTTLILLAYADAEPVGIATCFRGFSTFLARPLINIHDLSVLPVWRGRGIGRRLLEAIAGIAKERGCCKVTLEVGEPTVEMFRRKAGRSADGYRRMMGELLDFYATKQR